MSSDATGGASTHRLRRPAVPRASAAWIAEACAIVAVLVTFVGVVAPTLGTPLLEVHAFRQTQTAWTAREFHESGFDLLHPKLPVFGEPFEVPFEFPLFQALAAVPMELGLAEDTSLRLTSLLCFVATALLLWGLVRYVAGPVAGVGAVVAFVFTPLALLWSRTSMIEYLATAGAVGFVFALVLWRERRRRVFLALALVAGLVGLLVKPPTAIFWILPAILYRPRAGSPLALRGRVGLWAGVAAVVAVPLLAAALWTRHADAIKSASPVTEWLTEENLRRWNFGRWGDRLDWFDWNVILQVAGPNVVGLYGVLLVPAAIAVARSRQWAFWLAIVTAAVLPVLVFMNLYVAHDYYLVAVSPAVAALVGLGAAELWSWLRPHRWLVAALPLLAVALAWGTVELESDYWSRIDGDTTNDPIVLPLAREIASNTSADDLVAVVGLDWSPAVLYYAHRRGHMVTEHATDVALDLIHVDGYRYLAMDDPARDDLGFLSRWRWLGAVAPHVYELGDTAAQLPRAEVVATDPEPELTARLDQAPMLRQAPEEILCGRGTRLAAGRQGTWLRFGTVPPEARLFVGDRAPLPVRRAVFVAPGASPGGSLVVTCTGTAALALEGAVDASGPA